MCPCGGKNSVRLVYAWRLCAVCWVISKHQSTGANGNPIVRIWTTCYPMNMASYYASPFLKTIMFGNNILWDILCILYTHKNSNLFKIFLSSKSVAKRAQECAQALK